MKRILIILFLLFGFSSYGQVFTQTFVDRCTGEVKVVTANFVNGSATVAFYNKIRIFTYAEFTSGVLQQWLNETYVWWNLLSPCSTATQQTQQAQQTAQTAQQAAQTAASAATSVPTTPPPTPTTNTTGGTNAPSNTTNNSTSESTSTNSTTESGNTDTSSTNDSSTENGGGETTETKSEETETKSGESEDSTEENGDDGGGEEGGDEKSSDDDNGDGEESEEEVKDEEKKEEKKDEKKERVKKFNPIQVKADMMAIQSLLGSYDVVMATGASQTSLFGDETFGLNGMIWSNFRQFALTASYSKVNIKIPSLTTLIHGDHTHYGVDGKVSSKSPLTPPTPTVGSINAFSLGYSNNFGNGTIVLSANRMKPMGKWGTAGIGFSMANMFGEGKYQMSVIGYNVLYTNIVNVNNRITYAPAIIWTQSPYMGGFDLQNDLKGTTIGGMTILANSFTIRLTRRFTINTGWTIIKSTVKGMPIINSFMIGSKLPF
mgnify:FL=1|jgi:type II secretory pathway pseudopilin PulG